MRYNREYENLISEDKSDVLNMAERKIEITQDLEEIIELLMWSRTIPSLT